MDLRRLLTDEFAHEAAVTRRLLERLPEARLAWRPHPKSFTAGDLAAHMVECLRWATPILAADHFDLDPATFQPFTAASRQGLLDGCDAAAAAGGAAFAAATVASLDESWRLLIRGRQKWERPRVVVLRDFTFGHVAHHRGQFSVYLRLLDVPVPGAYGPSADEA